MELCLTQKQFDYIVKEAVKQRVKVSEEDVVTPDPTTDTTTASATPTAGATGDSSSSYPEVTKWESGLTRGVANTVDPKSKWSSLYTIKRGKGNTLI